MSEPTLKRTPLYQEHKKLGAKMTDFGGWEMPLNYPGNLVEEHLYTRSHAGLFDICHMGRFTVGGKNALAFLQHVLTGNAAALEVNRAQYTLLANMSGGAIDDCFLYRFGEEDYLLVVNAANAQKDWIHLAAQAASFDTALADVTDSMAMISVQGPDSRAILERMANTDWLGEPFKNSVSTVTLLGSEVHLAKTGYTGEALGYEIFCDAALAPQLWRELLREGASPVGLGARDTLRLEAGMPLYGHEYGTDKYGREIPIFAFPLAKGAVSFAEEKGNYIGRAKLLAQFGEHARFLDRDYSAKNALSHVFKCVALTGRGIPREGCDVYVDQKIVGYVSSGTMAPFFVSEGEGLKTVYTSQTAMRPIAIALLDPEIQYGDEVQVDIRGKRVDGVVVRCHLRSDAPPYARPIIYGYSLPVADYGADELYDKAASLVRESVANHNWRQKECINLIPSEMTTSPLVRMLSVTDPAFRYAEHKKAKAFYDAEIFYYQGTRFISRVEGMLNEQLSAYLGASQVESRPLSGQMANTVVYSALVDFKNRASRKREAVRLGPVMNNHISYGGHLSAQPMGALRDYLAVDPVTERPALINIPTLPGNPYKADVEKTKETIDRYRPELIIFGKSMAIYSEPIEEIARFLSETNSDALLMYDTAHVLGILGPHFQDPFREGAQILTGSTHKTFFGTQRGLIASNWEEGDAKWGLWERVRSRTFPGATSNHHLGTMLGLLMATYEMNAFRDSYQKNVVANAKSFAKSLKAAGMDVAGDEADGYTQTHQVIVNVGYARGSEAAELLEENNIVANYQATPREEGFSSAGALRFGVSEMTRFGFGPEQFERLAQLIADCLLRGMDVSGEVSRLRHDFTELGYCFNGQEATDLAGELSALF